MTRLIHHLFLAILLGLAHIAAAADTRPNLVLFLADDLSAADTSVYGNREIPTPNMASLARDGLVFDAAYVASPSCAPSRAALLSGRYGLRNGSTFNHQALADNVKKWPAYFKELGYEVVAIGKVAHYGQVTSYGFDYAGFFKYHEDICIEKAVEWLAARRSNKPLCLLVGTNWPHVPWPREARLSPDTLTIPPKLADTPETRIARAAYSTAVMNADRDLGMVREAAKKHLSANTVFVFSADHGTQFPFRKWNLYEGGLRVPLIVAWPKHVAAGRRTSAMVSWIDFLPTLLQIAGADPAMAAPDIDGRSFAGVLSGKTETHRDRIFGTHSGDGNMNFYPARSVRIGNWKYIRNLDSSLEFHSHVDLAPKDTAYWPSWVREAPHNPVIADLVQRYLHRPSEELYNLETDPDELHNLAGEGTHAAQMKMLRAALDEWMRSLDDQGMPTEYAHKPVPKRGNSKAN